MEDADTTRASQPAHDVVLREALQRSVEAEELAGRVGIFLQLFAEQSTLEEYLDAAVRRLVEWSGCRHVAIRVLNEQRQIPYLAHAGLSEEFCVRESCLSLDRDTCACVRVAGFAVGVAGLLLPPVSGGPHQFI